MLFRTMMLGLVFAAGLATPSVAQDLVQPVRNHDARVIELLAADESAFIAADAAYNATTAARSAHEAATTALTTALSTGPAATSPADNLGELAQDAINARVGMEQAEATYTTAMATLTSARTAYEAAVGQSLADQLQVVADDLEKANDFAAEQKARADEFERRLTELTVAVCKGHNYNHAHQVDYTAVCTETTSGAIIEEAPTIDHGIVEAPKYN